MGAQLSAIGVAGPVETFSRGESPDALTAAAESELNTLLEALNVAYGPEAGMNPHTNDALAWLRQWRDNCITGADRHTLLPCLMERAFARASPSDPASVEVKFLCTLCPAWARQILPEAMSETGTVGGWAAAAAALCTHVSRPCTRQFASLLAVATMLASASNASEANPMEAVHSVLLAALGGEINAEEGVLALLESLHALVTESTNQKLKLPPETRYLVRKAMLTRVVTVLETIDGFLRCLSEETVNGAALESAADLMSRCIGLATANVATGVGEQYTLQPELLNALPQSLLFAKVINFIGNANEGSATRTCAEFLSAVAELSSTPDDATYVVLNQSLGASSHFIACMLRDPLNFDNVDTSAVVNIVATYADLLLVSAANRVTVTDSSDASHYVLEELIASLIKVSQIPSADPEKSAPAHACIAISARSLHPLVIPVLEAGDAPETYAELQQADVDRQRAAEVVMQSLLEPCLDHLLTFERINDPEWDDGVELLISRRAVKLARQWCGAGEDALTNSRLGQSAAAKAEDDALFADEDDDDLRMISVVGGEACGNFAAAMSAVTRLVGHAPAAADGWLPLALAHNSYQDNTVVDFVHNRAGQIRFTSADDALLIAAAQAALHGHSVDLEALRRIALDALAAAMDVRSPSFLTAAYALVTVVVQGISQGGQGDLRDLAAALMHSRAALCKRAPLPRVDDSTSLPQLNAHIAFRIATNRVISEVIAAGAMSPFSIVLAPGTVSDVGLGWMALSIDAARVVLSIAQALGPAARSTAALVQGFRDVVFVPAIVQGQLSAFYSNIASITNEAKIATAKQLVMEFGTVFAMLCEAVAPVPVSFFEGTDPEAVQGQLGALVESGAGAVAVKIAFPLVELEPHALGGLSTHVFQHVEWYLPQIHDGNVALDVATAMCRAFAASLERPVAQGITVECAGTVHNAAAVVLPALATGRPASELAIDWPEFSVWIDRFVATLSATAQLASFSPDFAIPVAPVADAITVFGHAWRARAAANTTTAASSSTEDADAREDDWALSDRARDSLLQACAWWCSHQTDIGAALTAMGHAIARPGSEVGGILGAVQSAEAAAAALRSVLDM